MRFTKLYEDVKASDLFKPASVDEIADRKSKYLEIQMQDILDNVSKDKLPDGTWVVNDDLDISEKGLTSLKHLNVSIVHGGFACDGNELQTLDGAPKKVFGIFNCEGNKKKFTTADVEAICDVGSDIYV